jgi:clathrin heavy chain
VSARGTRRAPRSPRPSSNVPTLRHPAPLAATTIGIVTAAAVFHWSADGESAPVKVFDRAPNLAGAQVISYAQSIDGQWMMLSGIKAGAVPGGPAEGCTQLYSAEKKVSQPLPAHAGCFATIKPAGRSDAALLFCFVKYGGATPELTIIEIGRDRNAAGGPFRPTPVSLPQAPEAAAGGDFPVSLQASKKHDMLYVRPCTEHLVRAAHPLSPSHHTPAAHAPCPAPPPVTPPRC